MQHGQATNYVEGEITASLSRFCRPRGMVMYMNGFHFALDASSPEKNCINLWFPGWLLDSFEKFCAAMLVVVVLGIATEGIGALRIRTHKKIFRKMQTLQSEMEKRQQERSLKFLNTGFHVFQGLLGYMLMLAVMTYSIEMLFSCLCGVMLGYHIFYSDLSSIPSGMNSNPCCDFMTNSIDSGTGTRDQTYGHMPETFNRNISDEDPLLYTNQEMKPSDGVRKRYETKASDEDNEGHCCASKSFNEQSDSILSMHSPLSKKI